MLMIMGMSQMAYQCASPEMTTAKISLNRKDYKAAEESLLKELAKNKMNGEAWLLLSQVYMGIQPPKITESVDALANANIHLKDPKLKQEAAIMTINGWVGFYNGAVEGLNKYYESDGADKASIKTAEDLMVAAQKLRPDKIENENLLAKIYKAKKDTAKIIETSLLISESQKSAVLFAKKYKIYIGQDRNAALLAIKQPITLNAGSRFSNGDTSITDKIQIDTSYIYMFSSAKNSKNFAVDGWRTWTPPTWNEDDKMMFSQLTVEPYYTLAEIYMVEKKYDLVAKNLDILDILKPNDQFVSAMRIQMYQEQGKVDQAVAELKQMISEEPDNVNARMNLGMLLGDEKIANYDGAIEQYEAVIKIKPDIADAYYNLAAVCKSKAKILQDAENTKADKDKKYKHDINSYKPLLMKAANAFEQYSQLQGKESDFIVYEQLVNIYDVMNEKEKLKLIVTKLEKMNKEFGSKAEYHEILGTVYARLNEKKKAEDSFNKADAIRKK